MARERRRFDPYKILQTLDRHGVQYVVIGGFARVLQGTEEITRGVDISPSTRGDNLVRLDAALRELSPGTDPLELAASEGNAAERPVIELWTNVGELKV